MPCQWRSICPIVGRTASQCLERYEYLLDSVQQINHNENNENIRQLRPGEIDPNPETKPARPDAVDMDEDEKEMLSEARARLANTKGKKAKRKAREKQLEEARRLASLQKRRELKAAGIHLKRRKKKKYKYLQYNEEIPFYRKTPRGFWDTTKDDIKGKKITEKARNEFKPMFITEIEGERRDEIEERERKKDIQRQKLLKKMNLPELVMRLNANNPNNLEIQRKPLNLPQPQISENELEDIAKLSKMEKYDESSKQNEIRTPSTRTRILEQATNALRMKNASTPLLGGTNSELIHLEDDWNGVTPKYGKNAITPNINTPNMNTSNINTPNLSISSTPNKKKKHKKRNKKRLRAEFEALPAPNYEYNVVLPKMPEKPFNPLNDVEYIEDAHDRDQRNKTLQELQIKELEKKQSLVIQRNLPRPNMINPSMELSFTDFNDKSAPLQAASQLVRNEMMELIFFDNNNYPQINNKKKKKKLIKRKEEFNDEQLIEAKKLLEKERKHQNEYHKQHKNDDDKEEDECLYIPRLNGYRFVGWKQFGDKLEAKKQEFNVLYQHIVTQKKKTMAMQKKINIRMAGYNKIGSDLMHKNAALRNKLIEMEDQLLIYKELKEKETRIIPQRIEKWKKLIQIEKERQQKLQNEYEVLKNEHDALLQ